MDEGGPTCAYRCCMRDGRSCSKSRDKMRERTRRRLPWVDQKCTCQQSVSTKDFQIGSFWQQRLKKGLVQQLWFAFNPGTHLLVPKAPPNE